MGNTGKEFERAIQKSVPDYALMYRLPDDAQSFSGGAKVRFSRKNPFDFLMWDSKSHVLYALELKTVKGKSISFERTKEESREIHYHQIEGLNKWNSYDGIICGFVVEFREIETTIFISITNFNKLTDCISKKSFTVKDLEENRIDYIVIPQKKIRTRYTYDIDYFIKNSKRFN